MNYYAFEGDAKIEVDSLTTPIVDIPWLIDPIISNCLSLLRFIPCWHILHVKWEGNLFAHLLDRHALNCNMVVFLFRFLFFIQLVYPKKNLLLN